MLPANSQQGKWKDFGQRRERRGVLAGEQARLIAGVWRDGCWVLSTSKGERRAHDFHEIDLKRLERKRRIGNSLNCAHRGLDQGSVDTT